MKSLAASPEPLVWCGIFGMLLVIALLGPSMRTPPVADATPRAQPILLELAHERPEEVVGVIVQKGAEDVDAVDLVTRLGGLVTKDLRVINSFTAKLPARAVLELASAPGVRWVSLDVPVD